MIESIFLAGFQGHEETRVSLDPLVTTFVGNNDKGKSALLRAFQWLMLNKPPKGRFIHWDKDRATVTTVIDEHKIARRQGKRQNLYRLDKKLFKSFGAGNVPEPIAQICNVGRINFQNQVDPSFWFSETSGQVSKELNQIVNLGVIDSTLTNLSVSLRQARTLEKGCEQRLQESREQKNSLAWVVGFAKKLSQIEQTQELLANKTSQAAALGQILQQGATAAQSKNSAANAALALGRLVRLGGEVLAQGRQVRELQTLLDSYESLDRPILPLDLSTLTGIYQKHSQLKKQVKLLESLLDKIAEGEELLCQITTNLQSVREELSASKSGKCPLCGRT